MTASGGATGWGVKLLNKWITTMDNREQLQKLEQELYPLKRKQFKLDLQKLNMNSTCVGDIPLLMKHINSSKMMMKLVKNNKDNK